MPIRSDITVQLNNKTWPVATFTALLRENKSLTLEKVIGDMRFYYYVAAFCVGFLLHVTVFSKHYEWDRHTPTILNTSLILYISIILLALTERDLFWNSSFAIASTLNIFLLSGLFGSIFIYRAHLHPLRSFPGPRAARLTGLWVIYQSAPDLDLYIKLRALHNRYGDFVRIRPREISICHPDAVVDVHRPRTKIKKGEFYDQTYPSHTLQTTRDPYLHREQRTYWDKAFQNRALQEYVPRLITHYQTLANILAQHAESKTPCDASGAFLHLFFDVISDLTFGISFDQQTTKQRHPIVTSFLKRQKAIGVAFLHMPMFHIARSLSTLGKSRKKVEGWYEDALKARSKMSNESPDIYNYLSESGGFRENTLSEAKLAIIAGADTNAITVSNICWLLCRHPEYQDKLHKELLNLPCSDGIIEDRFLVNKPFLSGIINETLRLRPPVPSGLQRMTPPEGAVVAGRYIPGHMNVSTPTYALHRDPRAFVHPDDFLPERWSARPDLILRRDAFFPFGYGAYNCAGKPLAMLQLRMVVGMMFRRFRVFFAPGEEADCRLFIENQVDCFTLRLERLPLCFEERR